MATPRPAVLRANADGYVARWVHRDLADILDAAPDFGSLTIKFVAGTPQREWSDTRTHILPRRNAPIENENNA